MRNWLCLLTTAILVAGTAGAPARAQPAPESVRIGYVLSLSGPQAADAVQAAAPNYRLWIDNVNRSGGLALKKYRRRVPVEAVEIDDRSDAADLVRQVERLMSVDKADIVLAPAGMGPNLRAAPLFHKYGYPQIMGTAASNDIERLVTRFPTMFWLLAKPSEQVEALVEFLAGQVQQGRLGGRVALFAAEDPAGDDYLAAARPALARAGFEIVHETIYAPGVADLSAQIAAAKAADPDILLAWSDPPESFLITEQAIAQEFAPRFRFVSGGGASPAYKSRFGDRINGWFSAGGLDLKAPGVKAWLERHKAVNQGAEPDRRAGVHTYAGLEVLQQAIERVGEIDRAKILRELHAGTFRTLMGEVRLRDNRGPDPWQIGQWQGGEFHAVAPAGARTAVLGK